MPEIHSTGRGGAGNIGQDPNTYVDGSIVREGVAGEPSTPGDYSAGRGGAGNIHPGTAHAKGTSHHDVRTDEDIVPEPAMKDTHQENYHTGRGGEGNVHKDKYGGHSKPQSAGHMEKEHGQGHAAGGETAKKEHNNGLGDKVKHLLGKK